MLYGLSKKLKIDTHSLGLILGSFFSALGNECPFLKGIKLKKNIIFSSPKLKHPPLSGPKLRIENSLLALSKVAKGSLLDLKVLDGTPFSKMGRLEK